MDVMYFTFPLPKFSHWWNAAEHIAYWFLIFITRSALHASKVFSKCAVPTLAHYSIYSIGYEIRKLLISTQCLFAHWASVMKSRCEKYMTSLSFGNFAFLPIFNSIASNAWKRPSPKCALTNFYAGSWMTLCVLLCVQFQIRSNSFILLIKRLLTFPNRFGFILILPFTFTTFNRIN